MVKLENYQKYFSGKEKFQRVYQIGKKMRNYILVKNFLMFCCILLGFLIFVALILAKLLFVKFNSMLSSTLSRNLMTNKLVDSRGACILRSSGMMIIVSLLLVDFDFSLRWCLIKYIWLSVMNIQVTFVLFEIIYELCWTYIVI